MFHMFNMPNLELHITLASYVIKKIKTSSIFYDKAMINFMYLIIYTKFNIALAINKLDMYMSNLNKMH